MSLSTQAGQATQTGWAPPRHHPFPPPPPPAPCAPGTLSSILPPRGVVGLPCCTLRSCGDHTAGPDARPAQRGGAGWHPTARWASSRPTHLPTAHSAPAPAPGSPGRGRQARRSLPLNSTSTSWGDNRPPRPPPRGPAARQLPQRRPPPYFSSCLTGAPPASSAGGRVPCPTLPGPAGAESDSDSNWPARWRNRDVGVSSPQATHSPPCVTSIPASEA